MATSGMVTKSGHEDAGDSGWSGTVWHDPPLAVCRFRHRQTGEMAVLSVNFAHPPGGPFHAIIAARPDRSAIRGIAWGEWAKDRGQAREVWRKRELDLLAAGFVPHGVSRR
jgi:hypothetical protein